ncbi:hypothetical protein GDO86_016981 [Hymenochirus boettgeri]|uniref:Uncharacterized protein n=1 Tax=Hymenochirus boettgeri TaxID=247094 RepID=A0A8T2ILN9_9PIPI|nr:hypothetical protein GDO86_016981 [Hymenochirus boettgeri]
MPLSLCINLWYVGLNLQMFWPSSVLALFFCSSKGAGCILYIYFLWAFGLTFCILSFLSTFFHYLSFFLFFLFSATRMTDLNFVSSAVFCTT